MNQKGFMSVCTLFTTIAPSLSLPNYGPIRPKRDLHPDVVFSTGEKSVFATEGNEDFTYFPNERVSLVNSNYQEDRINKEMTSQSYFVPVEANYSLYIPIQDAYIPPKLLEATSSSRSSSGKPYSLYYVPNALYSPSDVISYKALDSLHKSYILPTETSKKQSVFEMPYSFFDSLKKTNKNHSEMRNIKFHNFYDRPRILQQDLYPNEKYANFTSLEFGKTLSNSATNLAPQFIDGDSNNVKFRVAAPRHSPVANSKEYDKTYKNVDDMTPPLLSSRYSLPNIPTNLVLEEPYSKLVNQSHYSYNNLNLELNEQIPKKKYTPELWNRQPLYSAEKSEHENGVSSNNLLASAVMKQCNVPTVEFNPRKVNPEIPKSSTKERTAAPHSVERNMFKENRIKILNNYIKEPWDEKALNEFHQDDVINFYHGDVADKDSGQIYLGIGEKSRKKQFEEVHDEDQENNTETNVQLQDAQEQKMKPFRFSYEIHDSESGIDSSHNSTSDGQRVTGEYRVRLPDGRIQIVRYKADHDSGYIADVKYKTEEKIAAINNINASSNYKTHDFSAYRELGPSFLEQEVIENYSTPSQVNFVNFRKKNSTLSGNFVEEIKNNSILKLKNESILPHHHNPVSNGQELEEKKQFDFNINLFNRSNKEIKSRSHDQLSHNVPNSTYVFKSFEAPISANNYHFSDSSKVNDHKAPVNNDQSVSEHLHLSLADHASHYLAPTGMPAKVISQPSVKNDMMQLKTQFNFPNNVSNAHFSGHELIDSYTTY